MYLQSRIVRSLTVSLVTHSHLRTHEYLREPAASLPWALIYVADKNLLELSYSRPKHLDPAK